MLDFLLSYQGDSNIPRHILVGLRLLRLDSNVLADTVNIVQAERFYICLKTFLQDMVSEKWFQTDSKYQEGKVL